MEMLWDGRCDVSVVDAGEGDDGDLRTGLTISQRPHVGDVIRLQERHIDSRRGAAEREHPFVLADVPDTLAVRDGEPTLRPGSR